jgi:8-oxo-dGTP diphosphatase
LWEFPGGKIEPGESPEECLVRECLEELEIEIEVLDLFEETKYSYPEREIEFMFFSASLKKGVPTPNVHDSIKWVSPDMLGEYEFCPADVFVVERLAKEN